MAGAQLDPGLGTGGFSQHPLEGNAPAVQPGRHSGLAGQNGRHRPSRQQAGPDLGHLSQQRLGDLLPEKVRMMELHHALAVPPLAGWPRITVDHRDPAPAPRQRDRGVQPGRPRPDDNRTHEDPPFPGEGNAPVPPAVPYRPEPAARQRHRGMRPAAAARQAGTTPACGPASPLKKNGEDSTPPDTPTSRRPRSCPATHASCTRITQPRVHGLDDDDIQLHNGTSRPTVSVR